MREKRLPSGIRLHRGWYQVRYYGTDGGKRHAQSFDRLTDAKRFQRDTETDKDWGKWRNPRDAQIPFEEWAQAWFASRHKLGDSKRAKNESILRLHIIGDAEHGFGRVPIGRITPRDVQDWVNWMRAAGYRLGYIREPTRSWLAFSDLPPPQG